MEDAEVPDCPSAESSIGEAVSLTIGPPTEKSQPLIAPASTSWCSPSMDVVEAFPKLTKRQRLVRRAQQVAKISLLAHLSVALLSLI